MRPFLESLTNDYITESMGGHCLVFLTPDLISESNLRLPKNLVSWNAAFNFYYDLIGRLQGSGRFHYFRVNTAEVLKGTWVEAQINSSARMRKLMNLAAEHRALYEILKWNPCSGSQVNIYSPMCSSTNTEAVSQLRKFWRTEASAILDHPDFADFRARLHESHDNMNFRWDIGQAALDLFRQMWRQREVL